MAALYTISQHVSVTEGISTHQPTNGFTSSLHHVICRHVSSSESTSSVLRAPLKLTLPTFPSQPAVFASLTAFPCRQIHPKLWCIYQRVAPPPVLPLSCPQSLLPNQLTPVLELEQIPERRAMHSNCNTANKALFRCSQSGAHGAHHVIVGRVGGCAVPLRRVMRFSLCRGDVDDGREAGTGKSTE